jgi:hypothetical protein
MATPAKPTSTVLKTNKPAADPHPELTEELLEEARLRQQQGVASGEKSCGGVKGCGGDKKVAAPVANAKPAGEKSCSGAKGCSGDKK